MWWALLALCSAFLLGIYDLFKKASLNNNAVIPVLFFATATGAVLFGLIVASSFLGFTTHPLLYITPQPLSAHLFFFIKSCMVGSSWLFAYYAFKHLPLTIVTPIRSSAPLWTIAGAFLLFQERLNLMHWLGIIVAMLCYYLLSFESKKENIHFRQNKWVWFMVLSTLIGAACGLYDKFLIKHYAPIAVQAYQSIYMIFIYGPLMLLVWWPKRKTTTPFIWRHSIIFIGITLAFADFAYFYALSFEDALVSVISIIRRGSVIIAFAGGYLIYKEHNLKRKTLIMLGILIGLSIIILGSS